MIPAGDRCTGAMQHHATWFTGSISQSHFIRMNLDLSSREVLCMIRRILLSMAPMKIRRSLLFTRVIIRTAWNSRVLHTAMIRAGILKSHIWIRSSKTREFPISVTRKRSGIRSEDAGVLSLQRRTVSSSMHPRIWKTGRKQENSDRKETMWRVYGNARICSRLSIKEKMYGFLLSAWRKLPKMTTAKCSISWAISMEKNSSAPTHPMSRDGWMKASTTMQPLHSRMRKMFCWWDGVWTGSMQHRLRQKSTVARQPWRESCPWQK